MFVPTLISIIFAKKDDEKRQLKHYNLSDQFLFSCQYWFVSSICSTEEFVDNGHTLTLTGIHLQYMHYV